MRYAIARDSKEGVEYSFNGAHADARQTIRQTCSKLEAGQSISVKDVTALESAVRAHNSPENIALYSIAKWTKTEVPAVAENTGGPNGDTI